MAGFLLPIRYPNGMCRFAGVGAWQEWAQLPEIQFFHDQIENNFTPERGDIVIYEKLITTNSHDHIGVILSCTKDSILVAEGNVDNLDQSGIVQRNRWDKIAGYIRIDNNYTYSFSGEYDPQLD